MNDFINSLPRWALVGGALALGLVFILITNPPHTACDSQLEIFQKSETPFLYPDSSKKFADQTLFQKSIQTCKDQNLPGPCFQFFEGLRLLIKDIKTVSLECRPKIVQSDLVSSALWLSLTAIFEIAWGPTPPKSYYEKTGWLDNVHINTFCDLQKVVRENFSEDDWVQFREKVLQSLPQASSLGRGEVWNRSLFTLKCP